MSANTTRRQMFGAPAALLLLAAPEAGASKVRDRDLIAACARFEWLESEYGRLCRLTDWPTAHVMTPAEAALEAEFKAVIDEQREKEGWIAETPASTPEGLQAKARTALIFVRDDGVTDELVLSVLRQMAGAQPCSPC